MDVRFYKNIKVESVMSLDDCAADLFYLDNITKIQFLGKIDKEFVNNISRILPGKFTIENKVTTWTGEISGARLYCLYSIVRIGKYNKLRDTFNKLCKVMSPSKALPYLHIIMDMDMVEDEGIYYPTESILETDFGSFDVYVIPKKPFNINQINPKFNYLNDQFKYLVTSELPNKIKKYENINRKRF